MILIWSNLLIILALFLFYFIYCLFFEGKLFLDASIRTDYQLFYSPVILAIVNLILFVIVNNKNFIFISIFWIINLLLVILLKRIHRNRLQLMDEQLIEEIKFILQKELDYADCRIYLQRLLSNNRAKVIVEINQNIHVDSNKLDKLIELKNYISSNKAVNLEIKYLNFVIGERNQIIRRKNY